MKKIGLLLVFLVTLGASQSFGLGIGIAYTPWFGLGDAATSSNGAALTLKLDSTDFIFGVGFSAGPNATNMGLTADLWLANGRLIDFLNFYAGVGGYGQILIADTSYIDAGVRIPLGINAFLLNNTIELFLELAPAIGIGVGGETLTFPSVNLQGAVGFRFWF
jgi:hypothetical protein